MAAVGVQYQFNQAEFRAKLRVLREAASNTREGPIRAGYERALEIYTGDLRTTFGKKSRGNGGWVPLSPVTLAIRRRKRIRSRRILYVTGGLFASLKIGGAFLLQRIANGFRIRFSRSTYGKRATFHHFGGRFGKAKVPARPILVPAEGVTLERMRQTITRGYQVALRQAEQRASQIKILIAKQFTPR